MRDVPANAASAVLPLQRGDTGAAVADLQARLRALGFDIADPPGRFADGTERAVAAFQSQRGLPEDGLCEAHTWSVIVEAGFRLGSRLLYRRRPMQRGDDVADLQRRLSQLGFDCRSIDGIFGDDTVTAVTEFQRNVGLRADGIFGRRSLEELERMSVREGAARLVTPLRERLAIVREDARDGLAGRRVAVVEPGGFSAGAAAICRALRDAGTTSAFPFTHRDASRGSRAANDAGVDVVVAFALQPEVTTCRVAYYHGFRYESAASRRLAELVQQRLPKATGLDDAGVVGMALPILRETRMPAVLVELGTPDLVVSHLATLADAVVDALRSWFGADWS
ncbi:MAG: peptidoglycan-binding protein [Acidimicrobiales bacterium]